MGRDAFDLHERERTRMLIAQAVELRKQSEALVGRSAQLCNNSVLLSKIPPKRRRDSPQRPPRTP